MGQYYKAYIRGTDGQEWAYNPQNAIYLTANGLQSDAEATRHSWDMDDPKSWGRCFSGMKLMEHSWLGNDYVSGIVEQLWGNPCRVAWVGDYATDFDELYTREVYAATWGEDVLPEGPFDAMPSIRREGFIINHEKGLYIDLAEYGRRTSYTPSWDKTGSLWCIHPLPLLTAIGNGRGSGDYHGACMEMVGAWAMDTLSYREDRPSILEEIDYGLITFKED